MVSDKIKESLKTVPLFSGLEGGDLSALQKISKTKRFPKENILFQQGDAGDAFYLILEGEVKVTLSEGDGREYILAFLTEGDFFGEMSIFDSKPRSASVVTTTDSSFLVIHREAFLNYVKVVPGIMIEFLMTLCHRLRKTSEQVGDLALLNVYGRIVKALLLLGETAGEKKDDGVLIIPKRPTHQDLASMVGTTRETVTRIFNELKQQGHIAYSGRTLVMKEDSLRDYLDTLSASLC